jgi:hypothetical protein
MQFNQRASFISSCVLMTMVALPTAAQEPVQWRVEDGGNGHWYRLFITGPKTWTAARAECASRGGYLATPTSEAENAFIVSLARRDLFPAAWVNDFGGNAGGPWIGGFQPDNAPASQPWAWVSGEAWGWTGWAPGEPNGGYGPGQSVTGLLGHANSNFYRGWSDAGLGDFPPYPLPPSYLCEWSADCNNDGIVDFGQIRDGTFADLNANGVPDQCERLLVPSQYSSIQSAIDASVDGNTVVIAPGTYFETCDASGKSITIVAEVSGLTVWQPSEGRCLWTATTSTNSLKVQGIIFAGGTLEAAGSAQNGSAVDLEGFGAKSLEDCVIRDNLGRAAAELSGDGSSVIGCSFIDNRTGLSLAHGTNMLVEDCLFLGNEQLGASGGGPWVPADIDLYNGSFTIRGCHFDGSYSVGGAPIRLVSGPALVESCSFAGTIGGAASLVQSYYTANLLSLRDSVACNVSMPYVSIAYNDLGGNVLGGDCADCDADGETDRLEIVLGAPDRNNNGVPDDCACPGDISGNGTVDATDLANMLSQWGTNGQGEFGADIDGSGLVDGLDLSVVLSGWGVCPG